jgi:hypothetical protein
MITARISASPTADIKKGDLVGVAEAVAGQRGIRVRINDEVK